MSTENLYMALQGENSTWSLLTHDELIARAERGETFQRILKVSQEMELRYQIVPKKMARDQKVEAPNSANTGNEKKRKRTSGEKPL